ncbi:transposase [Myxococcus sp. MxC21-1]|uniref:transposase n=1 Tax=Myxococcus sp. MxC21-1 TaxID=3041439 RepID=UPI002930F1E8|nr:transposase [Myxococcus sp. MxC21-1]WNZ60915.1 transposase [Myxococcus sp. MxC21-1]
MKERTPRVDWAELFRRTFDFDVFGCSRLWLPTPGKNVRVGVVGALRYPDQRFLFTHQPDRVTSSLFPPLLEKLVAHAKRTDRRIVLVLDNGNTFTARRAQAALEQAAPWVRPFWLPRYTSETLSWIEGYWEDLKDTYFSRMLTEEREAFYPDAVRLLHRLQRTGRPGALAPRTTL